MTILLRYGLRSLREAAPLPRRTNCYRDRSVAGFPTAQKNPRAQALQAGNRSFPPPVKEFNCSSGHALLLLSENHGVQHTMNRREFITSTGAAGLVAANGFAPASGAKAAPVRRALMKLGDQTAPTNETHLK